MTRRVSRSDTVLVLLAGILVAVWLAVPKADSERKRLVVDWSEIKERSPDKIDLRRGVAHLALVLRPDSNSPTRYISQNYEANTTDPVAVDRLVNALAQLEVLRPVASADLHHGLDHPVVTIELATANGVRKLALGANAASPVAARFARIEHNAETEIVVLSPASATAVAIDPFSLLEHRVLDCMPSELRRVELRGSADPLVLERSAAGRWSLATAPRSRARRDTVQRLLLALSELKFTRFIDSAAAAPTKPDSAKLEILLLARRDDRDIETRLQIGGQCASSDSERLLIREGPRRLVGCVDAKLAEDFALKSSDIAENAAFSLHSDEVERLSVSGLGSPFTLTRDGASFRMNGSQQKDVPLPAGNALLDSLVAVRGRITGTCTFDPKQSGTMLTLRSYVVGDDGPTDEHLQWRNPTDDRGRRVCRDDGIELLLPAESGLALDVDPTMLRDPILVNVPVEAITDVKIDCPAGRQHLRSDAQAGFVTLEPRLGPVDNSAAEGLREGLAQLRAVRWLPLAATPSTTTTESSVLVEFRVASMTASLDNATQPQTHRLRLAIRHSRPTVGWFDGDASPFVVNPTLVAIAETLALDRAMLRLAQADRLVTLLRGPNKIRFERQDDRWLVHGTNASSIDPKAVIAALENLEAIAIESAPISADHGTHAAAQQWVSIHYIGADEAEGQPRLRFRVGPAFAWRGQMAHRIATDASGVRLIVRAADLQAILRPFGPSP